ncbi:MAG: H-X9-DG-CTERM domain-containing protein [Abditibacteriaceae bacterium]
MLLNDSFSQNASAWDTGGCGSGSGYVTGSTGPVLYECIKGGPTLAALTNGGTPYPSVRHLDGANFAFADGHVKWEKGQSESNATMGGVYSGDTTTTTSNGAPTYSLQ